MGKMNNNNWKHIEIKINEKRIKEHFLENSYRMEEGRINPKANSKIKNVSKQSA